MAYGIGRHPGRFRKELSTGDSAMRIDWTEGAVPPLIVLALLAWVFFGAVVYVIAG